MPDFLRSASTDQPLWVLALVVFGGLPLLGIGLQSLIRKVHPPPRAMTHNDVAGFLVAVIGVIYAVTVGFTIADQWENYSRARDDVSHEAFLTAALANGAAVLEPADRRAIERAVVDYNRAVVDWWPGQDGTGGSGAAPDSAEAHVRSERAHQRVLRLLGGLRPADEAQRAYIDVATEELARIATLRAHRVHDASRSHLERPMWIAVLMASAVTMLFCLLFGLESPWLHYAMIGGISLIVGINLFLVVLLDSPLSGTLSVTPDAYRSVIGDFSG